MIRDYRPSDFETIVAWWDRHDEPAPLLGMMGEGTFVAELDGKPVMTLTALMTQSKEISYLEGFCSMPGLPARERWDLGNALWEHAYGWLKERGFKRVLGFTNRHGLFMRYQELGLAPLLDGMHAMGRVL